MQHWALIYGDDVDLSDRSELSIPLLLDSPYLAYSAIGNVTPVQVGTFQQWEFVGAPGWIVIARYPAYRGKNLLVITDGFEEQYKLSFLKASTRSAIVNFSLKIWKPTMPLSRATGSVVVEASSTVTATSANASISPVTVLDSNDDRRGATIWNASTATLYLDLGSSGTVSPTEFAVALEAGAYYELPFGYKGRVRGVWTAETGSAMVREYR